MLRGSCYSSSRRASRRRGRGHPRARRAGDRHARACSLAASPRSKTRSTARSMSIGVQVFVLFVRTHGRRPDGRLRRADGGRPTRSGSTTRCLLVAIDDRTDYIWVSDSLDEITDDELDAIITEDARAAPARRRRRPAPRSRRSRRSAWRPTPPAPTVGPIVPGPVSPVAVGRIRTDGGGTSGGGSASGRSSPRPPRGRWLPPVPVVAGAPCHADGSPGSARRAAETGRAERAGTRANRRTRCSSRRTSASATPARRSISPRPSTDRRAVVELRDAVGQAARTNWRRPSRVRQRLDDDAAGGRGDARCDAARDRRADDPCPGDARSPRPDRIRQLRDLERDAPSTLVELPGRIEAVEDRLPAARSALDGAEGVRRDGAGSPSPATSRRPRRAWPAPATPSSWAVRAMAETTAPRSPSRRARRSRG